MRISESQPCKVPSKKDKNWYLVQVKTGKRVQLVESGPFTLYVHEGESCIISALEDEGSFCASLFPQSKKAKPAPKDEKTVKPPNTPKSEDHGANRPKPLRGMEPKSAGRGWTKLLNVFVGVFQPNNIDSKDRIPSLL